MEIIKKLDGQLCLGESLKVRKIGEETTETNIQASVTALNALNMLTGARKNQRSAAEDETEDPYAGLESGPTTLITKTNSLKTLNPSRILKISNVFDRECELTPDVYEELKEDFEGEMSTIG